MGPIAEKMLIEAIIGFNPQNSIPFPSGITIAAHFSAFTASHATQLSLCNDYEFKIDPLDNENIY